MDLAERHAVRIIGDGEPTYLLCHGLGGHQGQWQPIADALSATARVITFDIAGSGASDPTLYSPVRHSSVFGFADDIAALCAALDLRGAVCIAHSISGMAALLAAAADPGLFSRIVTIGSTASYVDDPDHGYTGGFDEQTVSTMLAAAESDFTMWAAGFAPLLMKNADRPELTQEFAASLRGYRPDLAITVFRAAFTGDFRAHMPKVRTPTLVLQGTDDPAVPIPAARWLAHSVQDGTFEELYVEGHFPHVVAPHLVLDAIRSWMGRRATS